MTNSCPKCRYDNPEDTAYCGKCGTKLVAAQGIGSLKTETLIAPREELTTGSAFAGRYQIIEELGRGGMGKVYKARDHYRKFLDLLKDADPGIPEVEDAKKRSAILG